jgi:hypothetical protein
MREPLDDRQLERALADIGDRLDYPRTNMWPAVRARIAERRALPWWSFLVGPRLAPVAATLALLIVVTALLTPGIAARAAEVLGLPGIQIFRVRETPPPVANAPLTFDGQKVSSLAEASRIAGFEVRAPAELGAPDAIYVETGPVRVSLVYTARSGIPVSRSTGLSALVVQVRGSLDPNVMGKAVGPETALESVPVGGGPGYWMAGQPHQFFYRDSSGNVLPETLRLAGSTLLWESGGVTYRLEADVTKESAVRIALSLR